ncbi:thioredoxin-like protein [Rhizoctonia solani]|nr:thioredoxin-like protein [Rhizoctonia solani]
MITVLYLSSMSGNRKLLAGVWRSTARKIAPHASSRVARSAPIKEPGIRWPWAPSYISPSASTLPLKYLTASLKPDYHKAFHTTSTLSIMSTFYDLKAATPRNEDYSFDQLKGKVVLIVNVASKCGFTPQYTGLEGLYNKYKDRGFTILGFPCNQFGGQEPGTDEQIGEFCQLNHGVTFPLMKKSDVNGDDTNEVYKYLKSQKSGLLGLTRIKWNFEKFLIDRQGNVVNRWASTTKPESLEADIEKLL